MRVRFATCSMWPFAHSHRAGRPPLDAQGPPFGSRVEALPRPVLAVGRLQTLSGNQRLTRSPRDEGPFLLRILLKRPHQLLADRDGPVMNVE